MDQNSKFIPERERKIFHSNLCVEAEVAYHKRLTLFL